MRRIQETGLVSAKLLKQAKSEENLLRALKEEKAERGLKDLYFFCKYILNYQDVVEQPHAGMCEFISDPWKRKLELEPRNSFKSTVCTIGYSVWRIIKNPNIRILINSQDATNAQKFLAEIKGHFESNEELISLYGNYVGPTWTGKEIVVSKRTKHRKEPTIMTGGVETPRTGMHVDLLINDDLQDEHNTSSAEQIEKVIKFWRLQSSILEPGDEAEQIDIGTRWAVGDLFDHIITEERERRKKGLPKQYKARIKNAETSGPGKTLYFPTRLTEKFLETQRAILGSALYACQYKNNPVDQSATKFKKSWMKFYGPYPDRNLVISAVVDPAISEKDDSCDTAFTVVGVNDRGYWHIIEAIFMKDTPDKIVDMMFHLQELHNLNLFGIETVAFQKALKYWVWERMRQTGKALNVLELKTDTTVTKDLRIKGLIPFFESGSILWPGKDENSLDGDMLKLWDQVTQYPMSKYKDGIDSLAYHLQIYTPASELRVTAPQTVGPTFNQIIKERQRRVRNRKSLTIGENSVGRAVSLYERH